MMERRMVENGIMTNEDEKYRRMAAADGKREVEIT